MARKTEVISFALWLNQAVRLAAVARRQGVTRSRLVRECLESLLEIHEAPPRPHGAAGKRAEAAE